MALVLSCGIYSRKRGSDTMRIMGFYGLDEPTRDDCELVAFHFSFDLSLDFSGPGFYETLQLLMLAGF